jgi:putative spermidine/putrescine transport system permease protein
MSGGYRGLFYGISLLPLLAGTVYALAYSLGLAGIGAPAFTTGYWVLVLQSPETWISLLLSLAIALAVVITAVPVALLLVLNYSEVLENPVIRYLLFLPVSVPPLIAAFMGTEWLGAGGMTARAALVATGGVMPSLINNYWHSGIFITLTFMSIPFLTILLWQYSRAEKLSGLAELATSLGATRRQILFRVAIPVLLNRALPQIGLMFVFLFGAYEVPLLLGMQSPRMISVLIAHKFSKFDLADIPHAYALTVLYALVVSIIAWLVSRTNREAV